MAKKIVYFVGGLWGASGMSAILSKKINYLAEHTDYELYVILTEKKGTPFYYKLNERVKWVNFDIDFDELDTMPIHKKAWHYYWKQRRFKQMFTDYLMEIRPDITVSICRREINFINGIKDGSKKIGEIHFAHSNYRQFNKPFLPKFVNKMITKHWIGSFEREVAKLDKFVVLTHEDAVTWTNKHNTIVIPNFFDKPQGKASSCDAKRVIAVGRYTYQKGFDMLIEAWTRVKKAHPDWHLDIYGPGERETFIKLAERHGVADVVTCHPTLDDVEEEFRTSSIYAFSSRYEGFGMVLIEAMACGLPCVSFACQCGPATIISDGEDGILVKPNDIDALANGIIRLIEDEDLRKQMGAKAYVNVRRFSQEAIMEKWINLFESL